MRLTGDEEVRASITPYNRCYKRPAMPACEQEYERMTGITALRELGLSYALKYGSSYFWCLPEDITASLTVLRPCGPVARTPEIGHEIGGFHAISDSLQAQEHQVTVGDALFGAIPP